MQYLIGIWGKCSMLHSICPMSKWFGVFGGGGWEEEGEEGIQMQSEVVQSSKYVNWKVLYQES